MSMKHVVLSCLLMAPLLKVAAQSRPAGKTRFCMTEWHGFRNCPAADIRKRFKYYQQLKIDTIRLGANSIERKTMVEALKNSPFRIKLILAVLWITHEYARDHPNGRTIDEHGIGDKYVGVWSPGRKEFAERVSRKYLGILVKSGLDKRVDEVVVDLGPACEGIYPANWTLRRSGEQAFWCYSAQAQQSFRDAMHAKYRTIERANNAWRLSGTQRFRRGKDIKIPKPRTSWAKGPFWNDVLTWYRDSKRKMIVERIVQTQRLVREYLGSRVKCIVYLPGTAYTKAQWDKAVQEASGSSSIRLMIDNDWLMKEALKRGCVLQYTSVENVREVHNIVRKLKALGSDAYKEMWGENAGNAGRNPLHLARVITANNLRGIDFTWSKWIFEDDGVTPNARFKELESSLRMIREHYRD